MRSTTVMILGGEWSHSRMLAGFAGVFSGFHCAMQEASQSSMNHPSHIWQAYYGAHGHTDGIWVAGKDLHYFDHSRERVMGYPGAPLSPLQRCICTRGTAC